VPKPFAPQVDFAKRHLVEKVSTFNAASAYYRLELLYDDLNEVSDVLEPLLSKAWKPAFYEFVSYYKVGFVTCLEWHARSRLYDLFLYDPTQIQSKDIGRSLSEAKLAEMISEGLSVQHLLAGSNNVSTHDAYIEAIDRVLAGVGAPKGGLKSILSLGASNGVTYGENLEMLFVERNELVHEISISDIGHRNIRKYTSFEDAKIVAVCVLEIVKGIERLITNSAPKEFPNILDEHCLIVDRESYMTEKIAQMEANIRTAIVKGRSLEGLTAKDWDDMCAKSDQYISSQKEFVKGLEIPGSNYYDTRPFIIHNLLKQRILYLSALADELIYEQ